ncbi:chromosome partitioning protein [Actinoplanes sp. NPDC051859]|uniref:chromosome partitioning protein n=1 Tax=Actinoplanes sp. NPDC051859 TaxID=3363909 RepID=UPI0037B0B1BA
MGAVYRPGPVPAGANSPAPSGAETAPHHDEPGSLPTPPHTPEAAKPSAGPAQAGPASSTPSDVNAWDTLSGPATPPTGPPTAQASPTGPLTSHTGPTAAQASPTGPLTSHTGPPTAQASPTGPLTSHTGPPTAQASPAEPRTGPPGPTGGPAPHSGFPTDAGPGAHQARPMPPQPGFPATPPTTPMAPQQPGAPAAPQPGPPVSWRDKGQQHVPGPFPPAVVPPQPPVSGQNPPPVDPYQQLPWVSDGTPTAEEFARRRLAKPAEPVATMGARAMLQRGTMGLVRLAPGKREQEYKQDVEMVRRNFGGLRQVTVVNPKGGAGKTVAVLLLAMTFGQKRGGYVLAWDNNETQGTLGMRAQQDFHARTVRDMMRDLHLFRGSHGRVGDLSQYVRAQGEGMFDVLASDESATAGEMLTASAFAEIREIVSRFYKLIFVDTGNNVRAQNWQAAMDATDQLVITMSARNDSAETAARMLDHLEQSGRQRLVRQAVSVVTMPPTRKDIDLPAIQRHFAARTRAVLLAPYEKLIDSGEPLRYGQLSSGTRDSWLKIAAAVAEGL